MVRKPKSPPKAPELMDLQPQPRSLSEILDMVHDLFNRCSSSGFIQPDQDVVFLHTGGTPAIFAEADMLASRIPRTVR